MASRVRTAGLRPLWGVRPRGALWTALGRHFTDNRLHQRFGHYATYCGSSPFATPTTRPRMSALSSTPTSGPTSAPALADPNAAASL